MSANRRYGELGAVMVCLLCLGLQGGCGGGGSGGGGGTPTVRTLSSVTGPLEAGWATIFVVTGQGFGSAGASAQAVFQATSGTPFSGGTSSIAAVDVEVLSDTRAMGVAPGGGTDGFTATVELNLAGGVTVSGAGGLVTFLEPVTRLLGIEDEFIPGGGGNDILSGGPGHDSLEGYGGDDDLDGGTGEDHLDGGANNDTLLGGPGSDRFIQRPVPGIFVDLIVDFTSSQDVLELRGVPASPMAFQSIATVGGGGGGNDVVMAWNGGGTLTFFSPGLVPVQGLSDLVLAGVRIVIVP